VKPSACIIIPVKDEEIGLNYLFNNYENNAIKNSYDISFIFIIDHRTSDFSKETTLRFSTNILDQKLTTGKGAAINQAIEFWKNNINSDFIIFMDADASYSFEGAENILNKLSEGSEVVSGSRFLNGGKIPEGMGKMHFFGNRILSRISSIKNKRKISDLCTGLWGFSNKSLNALNFISKGFDIEAEIMGKCRISGLRHEEIGIIWSTRKGGKSKLNSFRDGFIIMLRILRT